ncbi:hypothetical protein [Mycolicibacterium smegmatis]|uniref:Transmembrane protein n=3 Tax=Mycolicibacterium smegmatis TaxID=1772 RepID=I7GA82_MYCS2|nr:hypothetical protein [Mycolicibacterium smegmatis]ABK71266.1 conserved hypothetical protein [Mycolicibacterium smegmatis MC2 155]AFP40061.1 hypothetical protein MSMEI_3598 [Mycolicibacterium smegmatis MC2 155]AIU08817.1 hypothetical protein LJ00_18320 [Mycolicibacterium smegmatis MC2 155]AIU15442.1 hypothetical protein LI99_18325 [Mycolicibacterium smegmatis]AIU22065.1 hypothetical protein LI98_18330 [Mycolicibacterium smegmatis]
MSGNGPFGFDPEDFDRVAREAGEGLRDALDQISRMFTTSGERAGLAGLLDEFSRFSRPRTEPETTGEKGDGVWAIYTVDDEGGAHIEQVFPTELDALRANASNTDPSRRVRFLPYGIAVSVLDTTPRSPGSATDADSGAATDD